MPYDKTISVSYIVHIGVHIVGRHMTQHTFSFVPAEELTLEIVDVESDADVVVVEFCTLSRSRPACCCGLGLGNPAGN